MNQSLYAYVTEKNVDPKLMSLLYAIFTIGEGVHKRMFEPEFEEIVSDATEGGWVLDVEGTLFFTEKTKKFLYSILFIAKDEGML